MLKIKAALDFDRAAFFFVSLWKQSEYKYPENDKYANRQDCRQYAANSTPGKLQYKFGDRPDDYQQQKQPDNR